MRKSIHLILALSMILISVLVTPTIDADSTFQESRPPTIAHMAKYNKFDHPVEPPSPLSETELVTIKFPRTWLLEHDEIESYEVIKVTFPVTWLVSQPEVTTDDTPVELRIPRKMLEIEDMNRDPNLVTLALTNDMFEGYSDKHEEIFPQSLVLQDNDVKRDSISQTERSICDYYDKWRYGLNRNDITKIKGNIRPSTYSNPNGYIFHTYHETETEWQQGCWVEFIL